MDGSLKGSTTVEDDNGKILLPGQDNNNNYVGSRVLRLAVKLLHNLLNIPVGPTEQTPEQENEEDYKMNRRRQGKCVVFNHRKFSVFEERKGTDHDVKRIKQTFRRFGFSVKVYNDYDADAIRAKIKQLSEKDHTDSDCLVVIVLSHGCENGQVFAKDMAYNIKDLWLPFTANRCPTLADKPKLFFFSACRGKDRDNGVLIQNIDRMENDSETDSETDSESDCSLSSNSEIPTAADFLLGFATAEGYVSHRGEKKGTCYIQTLCSVLEECAETHHLVDMLTKTTNRIKKHPFNYKDSKIPSGKQVSEFRSTLSGNVYFKPKRRISFSIQK